MDVIKRLNELRLERNMSVYRLAELSGLNQSTLANTFSRGTPPSVKTLEAICDTLGITMAQFFAETETSVALTPAEITLLNNYRKLPHEVKQSVTTLINAIPKIQS